jgi:hypothetical protein
VQNQYLNISSHDEGTGALLKWGSGIDGLLSKLTPLFVLLKEPAFLHWHAPQVVSRCAGYSREYRLEV